MIKYNKIWFVKEQNNNGQTRIGSQLSKKAWTGPIFIDYTSWTYAYFIEYMNWVSTYLFNLACYIF